MTDAKLPDGTPHPLRTTAIVICATLAVLIAAIPQSLTNWLREFKSIELQEKLLPGAEILQSLSERAGFTTPYKRGRELFLALKGGGDN